MTDEQPTGPQLADADLGSMDSIDLEKLATIVKLDLTSAEQLHKDGTITAEELRWVFSDAERVRNELIRRGIDTGQSWTLPEI